MESDEHCLLRIDDVLAEDSHRLLGSRAAVSNLDNSMRLSLRPLRTRMQWSRTNRLFEGFRPQSPLWDAWNTERRASQKAQLVEMPTSSSFDAGTPRNRTTVSAKVLRIRQNLRSVLWLFWRFCTLQAGLWKVLLCRLWRSEPQPKEVRRPRASIRRQEVFMAPDPCEAASLRHKLDKPIPVSLNLSDPGAESLQRSPTSDSENVGFNEASQ